MLSPRTAAGFSAALLLTIHLPARAATFNVADGDVVGFVAAVNASNNNIFGDTINLAPGGRYEFASAATSTNGPSALPSITSLITINGNGATLSRAAGAPAIRFFRVNLSGNLTINDLTLADGESDAHGGGALRVESGQLTMSRCTLANNHAPNANGGAVFAPNGKLTFTNCTLSGNTCDGSGGALYCDNTGGRITLDCVTMNNNSAGANGGGIFVSDGATLNFAHSLLAAGGCAVFSATVNDMGYNISDDGSCIAAATSFDADPMLEPLSDNGGSTFTHALPFDSPAVDAIPLDDCDAEFDQRGTERPNGNGCDIGAFEAIIPPSLSVSDATGNEATGLLTFLITLSFVHTSNVTVDITTSNGNAESGNDFTATQVTAHIPAGDSSTTVSVPVLDDGIEEPNESLTVTLSNPTNALLDQDTATGTILNDDVAPMPLCATGLSFEADDNCLATVDPTELLTEEVDVDPRCAPLQLKATPAGPYPFGTNTVTVTATDDCGQVNSCSVIFDVVGGPPPLFDCPTHSLELRTDLGFCHATIQGKRADLSFTTGCEDQTVTITNDFNGADTLADATFPTGRTTVTWMLTAADGRTDSCTTTIEVFDEEAPTLTCPSGLTFENAPEVFTATASDNCDENVTATCMPATLTELLAADGDTVTCTATDSAGSTSTCSFTLTDATDFDVFPAIDALIERIDQLRSDQTLNRGRANSLERKLTKARDRFADNRTQPACNKMNAFRNQVTAFESNSILPEEDASFLLMGADDILANACGPDEEDDSDTDGGSTEEETDTGGDDSDDGDDDNGENEGDEDEGDDAGNGGTGGVPSECADSSALPLGALPLMMLSMKSRRRRARR